MLHFVQYPLAFQKIDKLGLLWCPLTGIESRVELYCTLTRTLLVAIGHILCAGRGCALAGGRGRDARPPGQPDG